MTKRDKELGQCKPEFKCLLCQFAWKGLWNADHAVAISTVWSVLFHTPAHVVPSLLAVPPASCLCLTNNCLEETPKGSEKINLPPGGGGEVSRQKTGSTEAPGRARLVGAAGEARARGDNLQRNSDTEAWIAKGLDVPSKSL